MTWVHAFLAEVKNSAQLHRGSASDMRYVVSLDMLQQAIERHASELLQPRVSPTAWARVCDELTSLVARLQRENAEYRERLGYLTGRGGAGGLQTDRQRKNS